MTPVTTFRYRLNRCPPRRVDPPRPAKSGNGHERVWGRRQKKRTVCPLDLANKEFHDLDAKRQPVHTEHCGVQLPIPWGWKEKRGAGKREEEEEESKKKEEEDEAGKGYKNNEGGEEEEGGR